MKVKILDQVNSHWQDGRHFSAGAGTETWVDDDDKDAVAHMKALVKVGLAEIVKDEPKRPGRPPLPRDEDGNVVRDQKAG